MPWKQNFRCIHLWKFTWTYHLRWCSHFFSVRNRESIMGDRAERSSPEWACIPEIISDSEWFLWNTSSHGWTPFHTGTHDRFISSTMLFSFANFTKTLEMTLKLSEIMVKLELQSRNAQFASKSAIFCNCVSLKFDGWPWKTKGHLFYATSSFVHHFISSVN